MTKFEWIIVVISTLTCGWLGNCIASIFFGLATDNMSSESLALTFFGALFGSLASSGYYIDKKYFD